MIPLVVNVQAILMGRALGVRTGSMIVGRLQPEWRVICFKYGLQAFAIYHMAASN